MTLEARSRLLSVLPKYMLINTPHEHKMFVDSITPRGSKLFCEGSSSETLRQNVMQ